VAQARLDDEHAVSRVIQGVIVGIGFLGGGAIVKQAGLVRGAATAAAVWTTAALGVAVAARALAIAVFLALLGFGTLRWLRLLRRTAVNGREAGDEAEAAAEPRPRSPPPPP
jgi:putative Mg2+ transporter-C (MgtC) family protein